jgi:TetR/AcrR family transcriptional regulator, regulator of autoinduction and epiphytic fitness
MPDAVKRSYTSARRSAQARATRASIVGAASRLFAERGYVGTTIQEVADEADVAVQTVYAVFGNKRELLRQALEIAVTGDADPEPLADRPEFYAVGDEVDPRRRAELDARFSTQISVRVAPIMRALREAASADPDFATTMTAIVARRREDMAAAVEVLAGPAGPPMETEAAIGTLYVLYSPEVFLELTEDLGWSVARYERWLAEMLYRTVVS